MAKIIVNVSEDLQQKISDLKDQVGYKISLETAVQAAVDMVINEPAYIDAVINKHDEKKRFFGQRGRPKKV